MRLRMRVFGPVLIVLALVGLTTVPAAASSAAPRWLAKPSAFLDGVACPSVSLCFAVGVQNTPNHDSLTLIERWDGHSWSKVWSPNQYAENGLYAISCAGPKFCVAVGNTGEGFEQHSGALGAIWTGGAWRRTAVISPSIGRYDIQAGLDTVSCPVAGWCMAAGSFSLSGLVDGYSNGKWYLVPAQVTSGYNQWTSFSCRTTTYCLGLDDWTGGEYDQGVKVMKFTGTQWWQTPTSSGGWPFLALTCHGTPACVSVGSVNTVPIARIQDGVRWKPIPVELGDGPSELSAIRCLAAAHCLAVGSTDQNSGPKGTGQSAFAEWWNGHSFVHEHIVIPSGDQSVLNAVACPTPNLCVVVGTENNRTLIEQSPTPAGPWSVVQEER